MKSARVARKERTSSSTITIALVLVAWGPTLVPPPPTRNGDARGGGSLPTGFCGTACTTYQSCDIQGQNCGIIADGCGGTLDDRRRVGDLMSMPRGVVVDFSLTLTVAVSVTANLQ